jgi:hypothetical protein
LELVLNSQLEFTLLSPNSEEAKFPAARVDLAIFVVCIELTYSVVILDFIYIFFFKTRPDILY